MTLAGTLGSAVGCECCWVRARVCSASSGSVSGVITFVTRRASRPSQWRSRMSGSCSVGVSARTIQSIGGPPLRGAGHLVVSVPPDRISSSRARVMAT